MKTWTAEDFRNPSRSSGFENVRFSKHRGTFSARFGHTGAGPKRNVWRGPARKTALEAAQDAADYKNVLPGNQPPKGRLKSAGHKRPKRRKVAVPSDIEAARGMIRDYEAQRRGDAQGYVYCITDGEYVKIGYSVNPKKRAAELQTGNARVLSLLGTMEGTEQDERNLHAKYEHLNVLQEWFEIDSAILAEFGVDVNTPAAA